MVTLLAVGFVSGCSAFPGGAATACLEASLTVLPHPDDEWQTWGLAESLHCSANVTVLLTRGEQTKYCDTVEAPKFSVGCVERRLDSWLGFYSDMARAAGHDDGFGAPVEIATLEVPEGFGRFDDSPELVAPADPLVWHSNDGTRTLIAFDLGDGDLTEAEATWAVEQVLADPSAFIGDGPTKLGPLIGSYAYTGDADGCFPYPHPDHVAVQEALQHGFEGHTRYGATCLAAIGADPVIAPATDEAFDAAFGEDGAFPRAYGWLGDWLVPARGEKAQDELMHQYQTYWVRTGNE